MWGIKPGIHREIFFKRGEGQKEREMTKALLDTPSGTDLNPTFPDFPFLFFDSGQEYNNNMKYWSILNHVVWTYIFKCINWWKKKAK